MVRQILILNVAWSSTAFAKAPVDAQLNELILPSIVSVLNADRPGRAQSLAQRFDAFGTSPVKQPRPLDGQSSLSPAESVKMSAREVEQISTAFTEALIKLKTDQMFARDLENGAVQVEFMIRRAAEKFLVDLKSVCDSGFDPKTQVDLLSVLKPLAPYFVFDVERRISGEVVDDARRYSKEICQSTYAAVADLPGKLDALVAKSPDAETRLEVERSRNEAFAAEFVLAFEGLRLKREELETLGEVNPAEKMQKEIERVMEVSRELTPTRLAQLIENQFLSTFTQARAHTKTVLERLKVFSNKKIVDGLDIRKLELRHLARTQVERALPSNALDALAAQAMTNPELGQLSRDLDRLVVSYALELSNLHSDPADLNNNLRSWRERYDAWRARAGASRAGDALNAQAQLLERRTTFE